MKYAITYHQDFRHYDDVDEIIFPCKKGDESIVNFIPTIVKKNTQRIILDISEMKSTLASIIPYINQLKENYNNISVKVPITFTEDIKILKENNIPFIIMELARTIEQVEVIKNLGSTDVYIIESLGFQLEDLQAYRNENFNFRVYPDVAQSAPHTLKLIPLIRKFWIRPEDTELYENYIDTFEFFRCDNKLSAIFEIYRQRQWDGHLGYILCGDEDNRIPNVGIAPHFAQIRINCRKKCYKCNACKNIESLAYEFEKAHIGIIKDQYKPPIDKEILLNGNKINKESMSNDQ